jgi:hypothetical protein
MAWVKKIRPQIFTAMIGLGFIAVYALHGGYVEVATGCVGGMIAISMKLVEES